jgi:lipopolysaccharide/colanic/teichoic acid biosynthesis glycosyltransferase
VSGPGPDSRPRVVIEAAAAALLLVLLSPVLVLVALAVLTTSRGPVLFRQERLGLRGRPFTMNKFRTMTVDNDEAVHRQYVTALLTSDEAPHGGDEGVYKLAADPRVTRVGTLLRRTSLDELPQLWNVVRGEMAFVGPRPVLRWEEELFPEWSRRRFDVRPGLTGLWQVRGRSSLTYHQALELDVEYVERRTPLLDLRIFAATPVALLGHRAR